MVTVPFLVQESCACRGDLLSHGMQHFISYLSPRSPLSHPYAHAISCQTNQLPILTLFLTSPLSEKRSPGLPPTYYSFSCEISILLLSTFHGRVLTSICLFARTSSLVERTVSKKFPSAAVGEVQNQEGAQLFHFHQSPRRNEGGGW